jgi:hypothetical protein
MLRDVSDVSSEDRIGSLWRHDTSNALQMTGAIFQTAMQLSSFGTMLLLCFPSLGE